MSTRGIYGLSGSGIDVDSMVKVGMMTKQSQYDKMYKQEVKISTAISTRSTRRRSRATR